MSPDGSKAATWSWTEPFKVWDLDTGQLLGQFGGVIDDGLFHGGDFHPSLPQLIVTSPPNQVRIYTLDIDELVAIAKAGLSRDMTEEECEQYFREPCPGS
jgi:WD40 repeat protein